MVEGFLPSVMFVGLRFARWDDVLKIPQPDKTFALTSADTIGRPVGNANVALEKNGVVYALRASPGDSGYYHYAGNDLSVQAGDHFKILIEHNGQLTHGETVIPSPPRSPMVSKNEFLAGTSTPFDTSSLTVSWEGEDTFYFVLVECVEAVREPIGPIPPPGRFGTFRSRPVRANSYAIRRADLNYFGQHRVKIYKVNHEYANLYAFGQQDSRHLNEPETNIRNGLGIFAGFSSAEAFFRVVKP